MKLALLPLLVSLPLLAADLDFKEEFADPESRDDSLEQLVPGTRDWFFYRALDHQLSGRADKFTATMNSWKATNELPTRIVKLDGYETLATRELLLRYEADPKRNLAGLIDLLDLSFEDSRPDAREVEKLPSRLDPSIISRRAFEKSAESSNPKEAWRTHQHHQLLKDLSGVESFSDQRVRYYLKQLHRADHPGVTELVSRGLGMRLSPLDFGDVALHRQLTLAQLDELLVSHPKLRSSRNFATLYLAKLRTHGDAEFLRDRALHAEHLNKCRDFALTLPPARVSLKAHILFHHLRLQRELGNYPLGDFLVYISIPRNNHSILRDRSRENLDYPSLTISYSDATGCPPVKSDVELVDDFLMHFLGTSETGEIFGPYLEANDLKKIHARARLLAGSQADRWGSLLAPTEFAELREETRLDFAPGQARSFASDELVRLTLDLKNTPELLVRIYQLDLPAILSRQGREPGPNFDLDGLVPHHSRSIKYAQAPLKRHREDIELPELVGPGAWIVEFVANGQACRALLRKGRLTPYVQRDPHGQTVRVFNEKNEPVTDASFALGPAGTTFTANKSGVIRIPNSEISSSTEGVISSGNLAQILEIADRSDFIELETKVHLDREQLLADSRAHARMQVKLSNHGHGLPLDQIQDAYLTLSAKLIGGVTTEHVVTDELKLKSVTDVSFQVPADTVHLTLKLAGTFVPRDQAKPLKLESSAEFEFNSLLNGRFTHANFTQTPKGHVLELRGRNGEPLPNRAIQFAFLHDDFGSSVEVRARLKSDDGGRILLGSLDGLRRVAAAHQGENLATLDTSDLKPQLTMSSQIRVASGEEIHIPMDAPFSRDRYSLVALDLRSRARVDHAGKLDVNRNQISLRGLSPGKYRYRSQSCLLNIDVEENSPSGHFFISNSRIAPRIPLSTPIASEVSINGDQLVIKTRGAGKSTRVHLVGSRSTHPWNHWRELAPFSPPTPPILIPGLEANAYLTERRLDDEMRYILERRSTDTFPGSMLPRAGLLAQRWSEEDIDAGSADGFGGHGGKSKRESRRRRSEVGGSDPFASSGGSSRSTAPDFLDYLSRSSELRYDLSPDEEGTIRLPLATFDGCQVLQILVTDINSLHRQSFPLPENPIPLRDRRLSHPLDPSKHHVGTRSAAALAKGAEANITNILEADWRAFTTLSEAHEFLYGAVGDERLRDLSFLLFWPDLDEKTKLTHWSEHASHEFHLFLARKDADFFKEHVKPLLAEKREPTFIDDFLLERDLSRYLRPFAWNRLNAAEKALLGQALPDARLRVAAELSHRWEIESPTPEQQTRLFSQTLRGSDLATRDSLGLARSSGGVIPAGQSTSAGATYIVQKLRNIIIPVIDFEDVSIEEAIDYLRVRSIELDVMELDPEQKGINFVIRRSRSSNVGSARISKLRLRNVPLAEALNYICEATRLRWSTDDFAVTIKPATEVGEDLFTRTFQVPPDFLARISEDYSGAGGDNDPFAAPSDGGGSALKSRMSVAEALKANGIKFPADASAQFFAGNNTLMIRNSPGNLDLIESIISSVGSGAESEGDPFAASEDGLLPPLDGDANYAPPELPNSVGKPFYARPSWSSVRGQTRLWLPSNYYRHRGSTDESLIPLNQFWLDLAKWDGKGSFISPHFNACTHSANDALMCLALLDLPFKAERPEVKVEGSSLTVKAREAMLLFYKDTRETEKTAPDAPLLVRQTFHRLDDRFRTDSGRRVENTITGDFQTGIAYGAALVVTNPSGAGRRIDILAQIPAGAIPIGAKPPTLSDTRELKPYGVLTFEMAFYFPQPGEFSVYPMHIAEGDTILASAPTRTLRVRVDSIEEDRASWAVVARDGTNEEVLARLRSANLHSTNLNLIRWRLRERAFFLQTTKILRDRLANSQRISAYGFHHADLLSIRSWLESSKLRTQVGDSLDSPLLKVDPVEHLGWESLEFDPLVNPRRHPFGKNPRINFEAARNHYETYLDQLAWKPELDPNEHLHLTWFLLLQDRIGEAIDRFAKVEPDNLSGTLSFDYLQSVILFHQAQPEKAQQIALAHQKLPPGPWKQRFDAVITQAEEIAALSQPRSEEKKTTEKAEPTLELALERDGRIRLSHQRLKTAELRLYHVDLEMLFSKNPFLYDTDDLPGTKANLVREVSLEGKETIVELPEEFRRGNVLIAADAGSTRALQILDSQAIRLEHRKTDSTLQVLDAETGAPLAACYVKIYRDKDGDAEFHKDGYTDLRGKFDYLTLTDGEAAPSGDIAIFVDHPEKGSQTLIIER
ncbi:hypothetical protein [Haloferula sp.]|uniref:hypothetical protein n=1 Tax=Haloferula sp. TaxID=2497595 RepID=UPI00329AD20D